MNARLPPVLIARTDLVRLRRFASKIFGKRDSVGAFLMSEINRARLCEDAELPPDVVRLGEWVTYRIDGRNRTDCKILVCPEEFCNPQISLSVLSPPGAAILGLSVGSRRKFVDLDGDWHFVEVEGVGAPPNAPSILPIRPVRGRRGAARSFRNSGPDDDGPTAA
jgi:regulator of nucleoside diphosphate kinase